LIGFLIQPAPNPHLSAADTALNAIDHHVVARETRDSAYGYRPQDQQDRENRYNCSKLPWYQARRYDKWRGNVTNHQAEGLSEALSRYGIELPQDEADSLDRYCRLLWDWNRKLNLTRHTDYDKFVSRDLADSLQVSRLLHEGEEVLDVGAGGGALGVILAIVRPDLEVSMCESVGKKARALDAIVRELALPAAVHHARAEDLLEDLRFDVLIARAVGPLWKMCHWFEPHWDSIGRLLAVKGPRWVEERKYAREKGLLNNVELRRAASYPMAGDAETENVILKLWRKGRPEPE
jgi:16S rRNA (guanine527-N7)-methyltransferase